MVGKFVQHHHLPSALRGFITHGLSFSRRSSSTGDAILAHSGQCEQVRTIRTEAGRTNKNGDLAQVSVIAEKLVFGWGPISSQAPSTGLGHLSVLWESRFRVLRREKNAESSAEDSSASTPPVTGNW
jgi:hypothetical protein